MIGIFILDEIPKVSKQLVLGHSKINDGISGYFYFRESDCADVCSSDCHPVICHNCALADTCSTDHPICKVDHPICKVDKCGCDCVSDCPSKFQTDQVNPCLRLES